MLGDMGSVVAFGGGTGLGRVLSALAFLEDRLTGVVSTTDDGGSTGRLRAATGCIAWGDLRNCFNQMCTAPTLGRLLFEFRFVDAGELSGHNLGNLMLLALDQLTARPLDAVNLVREFLQVKPRLLPMSEQSASLEAVTARGVRVSGETAISRLAELPNRLWLAPEVKATPEVVQAVERADLILLGPGSFVTSVLPSLLVDQVRDAVARARCPRILIANLAAEPGPVGSLTLRGQLAWMELVLGCRLVDAVLWPEHRPCEELPEAPVELAPLATPEGAHDRARLVQALSDLLARLLRTR